MSHVWLWASCKPYSLHPWKCCHRGLGRHCKTQDHFLEAARKGIAHFFLEPIPVKSLRAPGSML
jgi:hypothetical protein